MGQYKSIAYLCTLLRVRIITLSLHQVISLIPKCIQCYPFRLEL